MLGISTQGPVGADSVLEPVSSGLFKELQFLAIECWPHFSAGSSCHLQNIQCAVALSVKYKHEADHNIIF